MAADVNPTAASILGYLATQGPMTGWEIDRAIEGSIGNFWNVTRSQVYRELRDLTDRGLVTAGERGPRERTPHEVTEAGRSAFEAWLGREPGPDIIRHRLLLTVFFSDHLERDQLAAFLATRRVEHEAALAGYRALREAVGTEGAVAATLRFGIAYEEMVLDWLDSLAGLGAPPAPTSRPG